MNKPQDTTIRSFFQKTIPSIIINQNNENIANHPELLGSELHVSFTVAPQKFGFVIHLEDKIRIEQKDVESPHLHVSLSRNDSDRMIESENSTLITSFIKNISSAKYRILTKTRGSFECQVADGSSTPYRILIVLNGEPDPKVSFNLHLTDVESLIRKETNAVKLFMGGRIKVNGDIRFATSVIPLFD